MTKKLFLSLTITATGLTGCGDKSDDGGDTGASGTSATATATATAGDDGDGSASDGGDDSGDGDGSGEDGGSADEGGADDAGEDSGTETGSFLMNPDGGDGANECDVFEQDCPDGQKCMPWANDGGNSWNATKCTDIAENPGEPGDDCTVEGSGVSGIDDCREGAMCYNVDPSTAMGVCYEVCGGSPETPVCDTPGTVCAIYNNGVLPLCYEECDPLLQDCTGQDLCLPSPNGNAYVCILDSMPTTEGGYGTPCEFANVCDPGLFCAVPDIVPGCATAGCCSEFCDVTAQNPDDQCTGKDEGQMCLPWWGEETPPPGYDHVGYCGIPL